MEIFATLCGVVQRWKYQAKVRGSAQFNKRKAQAPAKRYEDNFKPKRKKLTQWYLPKIFYVN